MEPVPPPQAPRPSLWPVVISCFVPALVVLMSFLVGAKSDAVIVLALVLGGISLLAPLITGAVVGRRRSATAGIPSMGLGTAIVALLAAGVLAFVALFFGWVASFKFDFP